ncbi:MAG: hypothetical protein AAFQ02_10805 [Bacteroidota bacterium]
MFDCEMVLGDRCGSDWIYRGRNGSSYLFDEIADPNDNCVEGDELTFVFSAAQIGSTTVVLFRQ